MSITLVLPLPPSTNNLFANGKRGRRVKSQKSLKDRSIDEVIAAYRHTGSVWKAGAMLGASGQSVHKFLKRNAPDLIKNDFFSDEERARIREYYETAGDEFNLDALSASMGRDKSGVCLQAKKMGLTDQSRTSAYQKRRMKEASVGKWSNRPHPRGATGIRFSAEALRKISEASKRSWATSKAFGIGHMSQEARDKKSLNASIRVRNIAPYRSYTRAKGGRRADLGKTWFRSSWEANYARYLNLLMRLGVVEKWEFEPETFWFEGVARGTMSYLPDFRVKYKGDPTPEYVELKGWVQSKDHTKWKRMAKYHPHIKLIIIKAKEYYKIRDKWASSIPEWEGWK